MISGVYTITNKVNGKRYIGSSVDIERRVRRHFYELRNGVHGNRKLQNSFNKHGESSFFFDVTEAVICPDKLVVREQYHLDTKGPEYNICKKAYSTFGMKLSEESKKKISIAHLGAGNGMYGKKHSIEAIEKIKAASILRKDRPETIMALEIGRRLNFGASFSAETRRKMSDAKPKKPVERIGSFGEIVRYNSISDAKRDGFHASHVSECCHDESKTHRGFLWRFVSNNKGSD